MSTSIYGEIPKRLQSKLGFAVLCSLDKYEKCILLLTRTLQFFEVKSREIIFGIDLSGTLLKDEDFPSCVSQGSEGPKSESGHSLLGDQETERSQSASSDIKIEKYIYFQGRGKRLFILLQVHDKLIVLERCSGYKLIQQHQNVVSFGIIDPDYTFRPQVVINFSDAKSVETTFVSPSFEENSSATNNLGENNVFKELLAKLKRAKAELSIHKTKTKEEFLRFKNVCTFGPNYIRSCSIEEKQPLGKYGDFFIKLFRDNLVIGIPVINNCSQRPTTLQNIRVVFICPEVQSTECEYTLYQLKDDSYVYENINELLESDARENSFQFQKEWLPIKTRVLQPECSGVIVLRMKWDIDLSFREHNYICFILYDIVSKEKTFTQQHLVQDIVIGSDTLFKDEYQVKFRENELYQDLLTISCTSFYKRLQIESDSQDLFSEICNFLGSKLGFTCIKRTAHKIEPMEIDESSYREHSTLFDNGTSKEEIYLHKENSGSYWFGTLLRILNSGRNVVSIKSYTKSEDIVLSLTHLFYKEFSKECKILPISCSSQQTKVKLRRLEDSLRKELQLATKFCQENAKSNELKRSKIYKYQQELLARELETDLAAFDIM